MIRRIHNIFILILLSGFQAVFSQGIIVLEKTAPSTTTQVQATQQVVLKPGFHAVGTTGSFDAKIGQTNSLFPTNMVIAEGSSAMTQNIFVPGIGQNYVKTTTYLTDDQSKSLTSYQYFDGLGRPSQTANVHITPSGADLVSMVEYDGAGREWKKYLPASVAGNFGQFTPESNLSSSRSSTYNSDSRAYVETLIEPSPLDRVSGEKGAGADWDSHPKTIDYLASDGTITCFYVNGSNQLAKRTTNYDAATLYITKTKDEDNKESYEFKDKQGKVILNRNINDGENVDTYYVYDDLGQLSYVLPPKAVDELTADLSDNNAIMKQYCYLYKYDERGNCIYKRLPGCTPIYMVYDKTNRLVLTQDGNQRKRLQGTSAQWTVTKYDALGRVTFAGLMYRNEMDSTQNYKSIRDVLSNDVVTDSYAGFSLATPLTINYYDNYDFLPSGNSLIYDNSKEQSGYTAQYTPPSGVKGSQGLLTGTRNYFLDGNGSNTVAMYYDADDHVVQTRATNHLGGYDYAYSQYDFTGKVLKTLKIHKISTGSEVTELYTYSYDNAQRPLVTNYYLNRASIPEVLASNNYDELGRLTTKLRHNTKDTEQYDYNIRNCPTRIQSGTFVENLYYNSVPQGVINTPCFNGNIVFSTWTYNGGTNKYGYTYDNLNRLTTSTSYDSNNQPNGWNTESYVYDKMGNITTLGRMGASGPIDALTLTYNGNQVKKVDDFFGSQNLYAVKEYNDRVNLPIEFTYDVNGNMVKDLDRNIVTIQYNVLNLPDVIQFKNGNQIKNKYDAGGHKLQSNYYTRITTLPVPIAEGQVATDVTSTNDYLLTGTDYVSNYEYSFSNDGGDYQHDLDKIYNDEGYVQNLINPEYYYFRHDHLGDNREVWLANTNTTVQRTQYYPSGLPWASNAGDNPSFQHRKYNGKEFIEMHGYDCSDLGARLDYNAILRTPTQDPHAENNYSISPYALCNNNPVNVIDPDGQDCIISIQRDINGEISGVTISATVYITGDTNDGRAKELNKEAKETFKSKDNVSFNINYQYVDKAPDKLKAGENVLTFSKESNGGENGHVESREKGNKLNSEKQIFTGNRGVIYSNGNNRTVLHETGHLIGLPDRYDIIPGNNLDLNESYDLHLGFENDLMRNSDTSVKNNKLLNKIYYDQYVTKAKSYNPNTKIINCYLYIGYDRVGKLKSPYESEGYHKKSSYAK